MKETLLEKINKIEQMKAKYEGKTFNAGLIDSVFSGASRVRKEADGNEFECECYTRICDEFVEFKALIQYKGTILKQRTTLCPFTNQPLNTKVKQYYVKELKIADGIDNLIKKLEERIIELTRFYNNNKNYVDNMTYEEFVALYEINSVIPNCNEECLSVKELQKYLSKVLNNADGRFIVINKAIITKLLNEGEISLRLARYLDKYCASRRKNEMIFQYSDLHNNYDKMINRKQGYCQNSMERINSIKEEIKEWEVVKGLYS